MPNDKLLVDIFKAYYDARRNKRNSRSQLRFEQNLERNLVQLYHEIDERRYHVGRSLCFITEVPVKREVFAADFRDRVVHHLLFNYIEPMFERAFIDDSYSCRKNKGTLYGIQRLESHLRACSNNLRKSCYLLKLDIRGYFMNIDRNKLFDILTARFDNYAHRRAPSGKSWAQTLDYDLIRYLTREIVFNDPTANCMIVGDPALWTGLPKSKSLFHTPRECGLPIGNLTSQLFSNIYLDRFDQYVKRELHCHYYGRYVDDFYIVHPDRDYLKSIIPQMRDFLFTELRLTLHPDKIVLQHFSKGGSFLGAFIKPHRRYPARRTVELFRRAIRRLEEQARSESGIEQTRHMLSVVNSYCGYLQHFKAFRVLDKQFGNSPLRDYLYFTPGYRKAKVRAKCKRSNGHQAFPKCGENSSPSGSSDSVWLRPFADTKQPHNQACRKRKTSIAGQAKKKKKDDNKDDL